MFSFKVFRNHKKKKLDQTGPIIAPPMYTKLEKKWVEEDGRNKPITAIPLPDKPVKQKLEKTENSFWLPTVEAPEKYYFKQPLNIQEQHY